MVDETNDMMVTDSGGKDFDPDPLIADGTTVEARVLGVACIGQVEKPIFGGDNKPTGKFKIERQGIISFELQDEENDVDRGSEEAPRKEPRIMYKFVNWTANEKGNLFMTAKCCDPLAAPIKDKKSNVNPVHMLGKPLNLEITVNDAGDKNNIKSTSAIAAKYKDGVRELKGKPFLFTVYTPTGTGGGLTLDDVPPWILEFALNKATDVEKWGGTEAIEAQIMKNEEAKEAKASGKGTKLEGDERPAEKKKAPAKKAPAKKEESKEGTSGRRRRGSKPEEKAAVDYSDKTIEELEDILAEAGWDDDEFNTVGDEHQDDESYQEALKVAAEAL